MINSHSIPQLPFNHKPTASEGACWVFPTRASKCFGRGGGKQCNTSGFPNKSWKIFPVRWKIMESHSAGTSCSVYFNILSLCCRLLPTFTSQLFCLEWTSESPLCMVRGRGRGCGWANRAASRWQIQICRYWTRLPMAVKCTRTASRPSEDTRLMSSTATTAGSPGVHVPREEVCLPCCGVGTSQAARMQTPSMYLKGGAPQSCTFSETPKRASQGDKESGKRGLTSFPRIT